jgi:hypothetical protein
MATKKGELVSNKHGYLAKGISKNVFESETWLLLVSFLSFLDEVLLASNS